ncbi:glycosyltransferase [Spirochaetia bacterium 38H-sp]|uniref:Glycosyltransferase n=1 Tax=Rarispira pelagica TaxID=3141764 RepID=A0ABU9UCF0_9SPIR
MRIGFISTYPPIECGIATYTEQLVSNLYQKHMEVFVMSPFGAQGKRVFPVFTQGSDTFAPEVLRLSASMTPDIIHIQHEYGLYGQNKGVEIVDLILRYKIVGIPVVVTLHTVYDEVSYEESVVLRPILSESSAIIVHEDFQKEALLKNFPEIKGLEEKIWVIEHGIRECGPVINAKKILGLEGKKVLLLAGYFRPSKRFDKIIDIFPELCREIDNLVLVVAGKIRNPIFDNYRRELFDKIESSPVADRIVVFRGQFPQHTFDTILSASDVMAFPYDKGAQSGMLAQCFAMHKPVVTSSLPAFKRILDRSGGGLIAETDNDYVRHIIALLNDKVLYNEKVENIKEYIAECASWSIVANQHIDVYKSILASSLGRARYIYIPEDEDTNVKPLPAIVENENIR